MKHFSLMWGLILGAFLGSVSVYGSDEHGHHHGHEEEGHVAIELTPESQHLGGIKTQIVQASIAAERVYVTGRIAQDVENVHYAYAAVPGTMERLDVTLGARVVKGQNLCMVRSIKGESIVVQSPGAGDVISIFVREGDQVDEVSALYAIADFSSMSAAFDVYEKDIGKIKIGQQVIVESGAFADKQFSGQVIFISPRVEETTFTIKIKVNIDNTDRALKLGLPVKGQVLVHSEDKAIVIPTQAIQTVEGKTVVFKKTAGVQFEPQEVTTSSVTKDTAVITQGLKIGDEIVIEGSFILKSKVLEEEMGHGHSH